MTEYQLTPEEKRGALERAEALRKKLAAELQRAQPTSYEEVNALFHMYKPPAGLVAHLVEFVNEDNDSVYYTIRLYRANFDKLTNMDRFATADWIQKVIDALSVVTRAYLEVWERPGVPGVQRR